MVQKDKIEQLYSYLSKITTTTRWHCAAGERYLSRILFELNGYRNTDIDGDVRNIGYDSWTIDLFADINTYFAKIVEQKNETTRDI